MPGFLLLTSFRVVLWGADHYILNLLHRRRHQKIQKEVKKGVKREYFRAQRFLCCSVAGQGGFSKLRTSRRSEDAGIFKGPGKN